MGLSEAEIRENEEMWREERDNPEVNTAQGADLRSVGITPAGLTSDLSTGAEIADSSLGAGDVDTGAGPAAAVTPTPGTPPTNNAASL